MKTPTSDLVAAEILRQRAEAARRGSEARHLSLLDHLPLCVHELDLNGKFLTMNAAGVRMLGLDSASAAVGLDFRQVVDPVDLPRVETLWLQALAGQGSEFEFRGSGRMAGRIVASSFVPVKRVDGQVASVVGVTQDITERSQLEGELRKFALAIEQSPDSISITNAQVQIEYVNDAYLKSCGYAREEVLGKNPGFLKSGKTPPETYRALWKALNSGEPWKGQFHNRKKNGDELIEDVVIGPVRDRGGQVTHFVEVKEDVTERMRIAEELGEYRLHLEDLVAERTAQLTAARAQAEAASKSKTAFLASMSHEIRTPMNAILGFTYLLQQEHPTPQQLEHLEQINNSAGHLLSIINSVLDLSKIEAGKLTLEHVKVDLRAIVNMVLAQFIEPAEKKGLTFEIAGAEIPGALWGDATRLKQALLNYVSNAVKFSSQGKISLRISVQEDLGKEVLLRFEVEDSGIGIAPERLARLFVPFEQVDSSITRDYGGTGLGLALTRQLAELMGGEAMASSEPGRGSCFWFTAKLDRVARFPGLSPEIVDSVQQPQGQHAGARILVADDNFANRSVAVAILENSGFVVATASNGQEAVEMALAAGYDLVLMDMQMPVLDGLQATRAIRAASGLQHLPILAMTANVFEEDRKVCMEAGMNDFVAKPFRAQSLLSVIEHWLSLGPLPHLPLDGGNCRFG